MFAATPCAPRSVDVAGRRRGSRKIALAIAALSAPIVLGLGALAAPGYILTVDEHPTPTDAIVVLGGFGVPRAELAARLYADGVAPLAIVTGTGDCEAMRDKLIADAVPVSAIESECASQSTLENAAFLAPIFQSRRIRSATIVTHWFHTRRALATFRAAFPDVRFSSASVEPPDTPRWRLAWESGSRVVLSEFPKIAWYAIAHGVFVRFGRDAESAGGRA